MSALSFEIISLSFSISFFSFSNLSKYNYGQSRNSTRLFVSLDTSFFLLQVLQTFHGIPALWPLQFFHVPAHHKIFMNKTDYNISNVHIPLQLPV